MESFVNGELVIMRHATHFHGWDGALGVVVGTLATRKALDLNTKERVTLTSYRVKVLVEGGMAVVCEPHQIRKLRKPDAEREDPATRERESSKPALVD